MKELLSYKAWSALPRLELVYIDLLVEVFKHFNARKQLNASTVLETKQGE